MYSFGGFFLWRTFVLIGLGYVKQILAKLHVPEQISFNTFIIWNIRIRIRFCIGTVSRRHCSHLHQHSKVRFLSDFFLIFFYVHIPLWKIFIRTYSCILWLWIFQFIMKTIITFQNFSFRKIRSSVQSSISPSAAHTKEVCHPSRDQQSHSNWNRLQCLHRSHQDGKETANGRSRFSYIEW